MVDHTFFACYRERHDLAIRNIYIGLRITCQVIYNTIDEFLAVSRQYSGA